MFRKRTLIVATAMLIAGLATIGAYAEQTQTSPMSKGNMMGQGGGMQGMDGMMGMMNMMTQMSRMMDTCNNMMTSAMQVPNSQFKAPAKKG